MSSLHSTTKSTESLSNQPGAPEDEAGLPRVFERHLLLKRIAKGGMGEVFLATSAGAIDGAERPCVVKVIRREHAEDSSFLARFMDEARIQAQLEHPGVVRVLHASNDVLGKPYVVLEHVEGRNLSELRLRVQQLGIRLSWPDAVAIAIGLAEALAHIHERTDAMGRPLAIVHRDLSPQNVMVGYGGDVKVIDFGTARGQNRRCHTVAGIVFAKPGYVAPEVANNQPGGVAADIYALGVMLWELLAGRRFISSDPGEHLAAVAAGTKVLTPIAAQVDAPPALDAICQRLTANKIEDRFESASEACQELAQLLKRAPSTSDGQRSVRVRIAQLMQRLYPAEPTRTRAEFQRLLSTARSIEPPASSLIPEPSPVPVEVEEPVLDLLPGTRYQVGERIGEGASSVVHTATHVDLGRKVALKLFTAAAGTEALEAFRREARNVAQLTHENIVTIHDFGLTQDGSAYLSMELLEGESMDRRIRNGGALEYRGALLLSVQICRALEAAHAAGIVHGDLKPANLFLTRQGTIKLLDFGLSSLGRERQILENDAESFSLIGTPEYLAPEQIRGADPSVRTDIYALGVVLYEMLTATRPYDADSLGVLLGCKLNGTVEAPSLRAPLSRLPSSVDRLCLRLLSSKPEQRQATVAEVRLAIERILDGSAKGQRRAGKSLRITAAATMASLGALASLACLPGARTGLVNGTAAMRAAAMEAFVGGEVPSLTRGVHILEQQTRLAIAVARRGLGTHAAEAVAKAPVKPPSENSSAARAAADNRSDRSAQSAASLDDERVASAAVSGTSAASTTADKELALTELGPKSTVRGSVDKNALNQIEQAVRDGKPLRALDLARHADSATSRHPTVMKNWILAAQATQAWGEAYRVSKDLCAVDRSAENLMQLATLERRLGHSDDARKTIDRLLGLYPDHAPAKAMKAKLEPASRVALR